MTIFLMNMGEEYFIRELTRKLSEQINSVRRELDNLKKMGLLRSKTKNRKKYYFVNKNFIFLEELRSIIIKAFSSNETIARDMCEMGNVKLLALSGQFIDRENMPIDMLIVGEMDREKLSDYLNSEVKTKRPVRFTIMKEDDYKYRLNCKDKFITEIIENSENKILIKKI